MCLCMCMIYISTIQIYIHIIAFNAETVKKWTSTRIYTSKFAAGRFSVSVFFTNIIRDMYTQNVYK